MKSINIQTVIAFLKAKNWKMTGKFEWHVEFEPPIQMRLKVDPFLLLPLYGDSESEIYIESMDRMIQMLAKAYHIDAQKLYDVFCSDVVTLNHAVIEEAKLEPSATSQLQHKDSFL